MVDVHQRTIDIASAVVCPARKTRDCAKIACKKCNAQDFHDIINIDMDIDHLYFKQVHGISETCFYR